MRSPPDWPLLSGCRAEERQNKLKPSTRLVASVREISVVDPGDSEHANDVESHAHGESYPAKTSPDHEEAPKVDRPERELFDEIDRMKRITAGVHDLESSPWARLFSQDT